MLRERGAVLFSDEVYQGLEHDKADRLPAACDLYEQAVSLGTVSKSYGLPGLRIGWVACRDPALLERLRELKLYTTICSSAPSELLVALALRHSERLIGEARERVLANLPLVSEFIDRHGALLDWVEPAADRSASRACSTGATCATGASAPRATPACCCFPATSTGSRSTFGSEYGRAGVCARRWPASTRALPAKARRRSGTGKA